MREALQGAVINVVGSQALHKGQSGLYGEREVYAQQPTYVVVMALSDPILLGINCNFD